MKYVIDINKCSGCSACKNICPQKCIEMKENEEGFLYPVINEEKCIHCNLCQRTCPVLNKTINSSDKPKTVIAKNKNINERLKSSSGGIFVLLAKYFLNNNGVVYGALLKNNKLKHVRVDNINSLDPLLESKYLQSDISNIYLSIKKDIDDNKLVLFVGTACQIAGIKAYLKKDYDNFYTCDLVCHGIPSPKVFEDYCKYLEQEYNSKIKEYHFRNKDISWRFYQTKVIFENNKVYKKYYPNDLYMKGFLQSIFLRKNCYDCVFKEEKHISDITLGDYWGNFKYYKKFNDKKGTSVLFLNSNKGEDLIKKINDIELKEITYEEAIYNNSMLTKSTKYNNKRDSFFKDYNKIPINEAINNNIVKTPKWKTILRNIAIKFLK